MSTRSARRRVRNGSAVVVAVLAGIIASAALAAKSPPSPVDILGRRDLDAPFLDAVPICVPPALDGLVDSVVEKAQAGEWKAAHDALGRWSEQLAEQADALSALDSIFRAREARSREGRLAAEAQLAQRVREPAQEANESCLRLERARLLLLVDRAAEAAAQLRRVEEDLDGSDPSARALASAVAYGKAEILYLAGRRFEAHMAYRKLAADPNPRIALAARLRLTDLSFDAGKIEPVSREYETLLPRAGAFGASLEGWSLRAAEAALDAGDPARALHWLDRATEAMSDRDARDAADIRRADLEVRLDDPMAARKRLAAIVVRRGSDPIGALAAVRAVDLGVAEGKADAGLETLARVIRDGREGLRRYALGVLMRALAAKGEFEQAVAVATRLAFDGVDAVVVPDYATSLDGLLARLADGEEADCDRMLRALGGRYGILIERASSVAPFARLAYCFERKELPWLAVPVYRTISRRFGAAGASAIALPLARASLDVGDVSLARHMADAALADASNERPAWEAIVAEADFADGRTAFAAKRARSVLDDPGLGPARARLVLALARSAAKQGSLEDARSVAERVPRWLASLPEEGASIERLRLLDAALVAGHFLRRKAEPEAAFALYRAVDRHAEAGALRSSARFWLGLARQPNVEGERAWGRDADESLGAPWSKVAAFEERYEVLRDVYAGVLR